MMKRTIYIIALLCSGLNASADEQLLAKQAWLVLQSQCLECHGAEKQKGGFRLDTREHFLRGGDSGLAWDAKEPAKSELLRRIHLPATDTERMPPRGKGLTATQSDLVKKWLGAGAPWPATASQQKHWAYIPPKYAPLPAVKNPNWVVNPIDQWILHRLDQEKLLASPRASKETLVRRLSLALTGLPPAPELLRQYLGNSAPNATEELVDQLLASPEFGVRWASPWLDYARYADSHGFQRDDLRSLWPYRDWVVNAFNSDMPYDRFTIEQMGGDLLPKATLAQKIATGFHRSAPTNVEAGTDPEETRTNQVLDRVNTLGMVWLGATLECAQCHDHKYDPISQEEYYRLYAFFNNTALEAQRTNPKVPGSIAFIGPTIPVEDSSVTWQRQQTSAEIASLEKRLADRKALLQKPDPMWEKTELANGGNSQVTVLPVAEFVSKGGSTFEILPDHSVLLTGEPPATDTYLITITTPLKDVRRFRLETLTDDRLPGKGPGRGSEKTPNFVLNTFRVVNMPKKGKNAPLKLVRATADFSQSNFPVANAIDDDPKTAWAINPQFHQPHWAEFELEKPFSHAGNGKIVFTLIQNYGTARTIGRVRLSAISGNGASISVDVQTALKVSAEKRTPQQSELIRKHRAATDPEAIRLYNQIAIKKTDLSKITSPTTLVLQELPEARPTTIFQRGDFRTPGKVVTPGVPAVLGVPLPKAGNRLDLAHWLVDPNHPLTARVAVNRIWAELFGHGLVTTPEDFGIKGEPPTHPELLDWLALEFIDNGWSMKKLIKMIVLSATYQQDSRTTPEILERDDRNLLYARGPRYRLAAETIRDNLLAISGKLSYGKNGPPIQPYQPDGIWVKVGGEKYNYVVSPGEQRYRRGLYVVWKRGAPYPSFMNFDATNRMACRVARPRTNTPLQALTLLNDPVYVELALSFAQRILDESGEKDLQARLTYAFQVALSRTPTAREVEVLSRLYHLQSQELTAEAAQQLVVPLGKFSPERTRELAVWYAIATTILNLDETITLG
ncbi:MAG: PSD1 and planctomycete cytochrome C domain-containing protein [Zavarzinella sp.]